MSLKLHFKFLLLISAFLISSKNIYSQWTIAGNLNGLFGRASCSVVDGNTAFATGGPDINATYKTTNGGTNWIRLNTDTFRPFWAIWAKDANTVFAGDDAGSGAAKFYKTTNGGINWTIIDSIPGLVSGLPGFKGIRFANLIPSFGIAHCEGNDGEVYVYKTRDGGNTWTRTLLPGFAGYNVTGGLNVIDSLFYAFGAFGSPASIIITTNGGVTWNLRDVNLPGADLTRGLAFKDKLTGVAGSSTLPFISRTTNGGLNWVSIDVGINISGITGPIMRWIEGTDICYFTATDAIDGGVLKSTNGGLNWTQMTTSGSGIIYMDTKRIGSNIYGYANSCFNFGIFGDSLVLKVTDAIVFSQLLIENFDYSAGDSLTQHGWVAFSGTGNALFVTSPGLTFPTYVGSGIGNATSLVLGSAASSQDAYKAFTSPVDVDTLSLYASFMARVDSASLAGDYFVALLPSTSTTLFTGRVYVKQASNGNLAFGLSKIGTAGTIVYSDSIYTKGTTYLLLLKYTFNEGTTTDDAVSLFVFSAPPPSFEPAPTVGPLTGANDLVDVSRFALRQGVSTPRAIVDGIYVDILYNNAVLPVELSSFTATVDRRDVTLNWTTATENNNSGFEIERSLVSSEWTKVGFIQGHGTTTSSINYSFTDRGLNSGKYNYRLKQMDFNANFSYFNLSNEVGVGIPTKFDMSQNYPNPFNPSTKINYDIPFDGKVSIKLFDMSGKEVATLVNNVQTAGYYTINFNGLNLSSGVYFYRLVVNRSNPISADANGNNFVSTKKMILVK